MFKTVTTWLKDQKTKADTKVKEYETKHPKRAKVIKTCVKIAGAVSLVAGGIAIGRAFSKNEDDDTTIETFNPDIPTATLPEPDYGPTVENNFVEEEPTVENNEEGSDWKYQDSWDKVNNFAKDLNLEEGEQYVIENLGVDDHNETVVSHLVDGEGEYPPEETEG